MWSHLHKSNHVFGIVEDLTAFEKKKNPHVYIAVRHIRVQSMRTECEVCKALKAKEECRTRRGGKKTQTGAKSIKKKN